MRKFLSKTARLFFAILLMLWSEVAGYNSEAPLETCVSMLPGLVTGATEGGEGHTAQSQNKAPLYGNSDQAPYSLQVIGTIYPPSEVQSYGWLEVTPGASYQVSIVADQTRGSNAFKGILLMARQLVCHSNDSVQVMDEPIGLFTVGTGSVLKTIACNQIENSAISHNSPQYKINEQVTWIAPTDQKLNVIFRATILQSVDVYWTDVYSQPIHIRGAENPVTCSAKSLQVNPIRFGILAFLVATATAIHRQLQQ